MYGNDTTSARAAEVTAAQPTSNAPGWRSRTLLLCVVAATLAGFASWLTRPGLIDDAYITLSYARSLAVHGNWGLLPDVPANAATSPLNVLLIAAAITLLRVAGGVYPVLAMQLVLLGSALATAWWWSAMCQRLALPAATAVVGMGLVLLNPLVLSSVGLEITLAAALLVGLLAEALRARPLAFGVIGGLLIFTRLDLVIFVLAVGVVTPTIRRSVLRVAAAVVLTALPWYLFSWWQLGSAIPDTFVLKSLQQAVFVSIPDYMGVPLTFGNAIPTYLLWMFPAATVLSLVPAVLAVPLVLWWSVARLLGRTTPIGPGPVVALGFAGMAYFIVYGLLGMPFYHWYYAPTIITSSVVVAVAAGLAAGRGHQRVHTYRIVPLVAGFTAVAVALAVDLGHGAPWRTAAIAGNWATPAAYERMGNDLGHRVGSAVVEGPGEIGALAYFCECTIVDPFADRGRTIPLIEQQVAEAGPVLRVMLRLNYARLDHGQRLKHAQYRLEWTPGHVSAPDTWNVSTRAHGNTHFTLRPVPDPATQ